MMMCADHTGSEMECECDMCDISRSSQSHHVRGAATPIGQIIRNANHDTW